MKASKVSVCRTGWLSSLSLLAVLTVSPLRSAPPETAPADPLSVGCEYAIARPTTGKPFAYRIDSQSEATGYRLIRLSFPSPVETACEANNRVPADYYLPTGASGAVKRPAVVCLHILNGNFDLERVICATLASNGIPAVMPKLPYYGERSPPGGRKELLSNPDLFMDVLPQGIEDVRRTIDVLAARPEVDPQRIGIVGTSMGGITAAAASEAEPRVWRSAIILAGGDLPCILHHSRETTALSKALAGLPPQRRKEIDEAIAAVDPLTHADKLRDRAAAGRVLMINASQDETVPRVCSEKLAAALGIADKVVWLEGVGHYTALAMLPQVLKRVVDFFAVDLPEGTRPGSTEGKTPSSLTGNATQSPAAEPGKWPMQTVLKLAGQVGALIGPEPRPQHGHAVNVEIRFQPSRGKPTSAQLAFLRGAGHRFRIDVDISGLGKASLGQGDYPWMLAADNSLFRGKLDTGQKPGDPLASLPQQQRLRLLAAAGALAQPGLLSALVEQVLTFRADPGGDNQRAVLIRANNRDLGTARLVCQSDGVTPRELTFTAKKVSGSVAFRQWQINTALSDDRFAAPASDKVRDVDAADMVRMFSSLLAFAMERME